MTASLPPRTRYLLAEYGTILAVALAVVGAGLIGSATLVSTGSANATGPQVVVERTDVQHYALTLNDSALVTGETPFWERGTRIRDSPVYFRDASPNLTLTARLSGPPNRTVSVAQEIQVVYRATHAGEHFWTATRTVASEQTTVSNGTLETTATLNVSAIAARRKTLARELRDRGSISVHVLARASYTSERYRGTLTTRTPLSIAPGTYSLSGDAAASRTHAKKIRRRVDQTPDGQSAIGVARGPSRLTSGRGALGAVLLVASGGLVLAGRRFSGLESLDHEARRARYEEWISAGRVTHGAGETAIDVRSLDDLVGVAMDVDGRVIHDADRGVYAVVHDGVVYRHKATAAAGLTATETGDDRGDDVSDAARDGLEKGPREGSDDPRPTGTDDRLESTTTEAVRESEFVFGDGAGDGSDGDKDKRSERGISEDERSNGERKDERSNGERSEDE